MSITNEANLTLRIEAEGMWEKGEFKEAAKKYYEAAEYANKYLNDVPLSKKLYVEHNLALAFAPGNLSSDIIHKLLSSIDDLIIGGLDDRLEQKFKPYKEYFSILIDYYNKDYLRLESCKIILSDKLAANVITEYESLSLILIEVILAKENFRLGKGNQNTLIKLSVQLTDITNRSNLPDSLTRKLREFAIQVAENNGLDEKKK